MALEGVLQTSPGEETALQLLHKTAAAAVSFEKSAASFVASPGAEQLVEALRRQAVFFERLRTEAAEFIAATRKLAGFTPADAWDSLYDFPAMFPLVLPGADALAFARTLHVEHGVSFWDSMLLGTCKEAGIAKVYSEDLPGGRVPGLEVVNPFAP